MSLRVVIVGSGLAGPLLACYLAQQGHRVTLLERRSDPRARGYAGGRSINLALSARGFHGLAGIGLDTVVREHEAIPMPGRIIHPVGGGPTAFQAYSSDPRDAINSVSRGGLNLRLIEQAAMRPNVELVFDAMCLDVDLDAPAVVAQTPSGIRRIESDLVVGADGAFSAVRARLQKVDRFDYSQQYLSHGYKELHIPPAAELGLNTQHGYAMDPGGLHIWPRGGAMMIALPNRDKSFTCTLFWPFDGEHGLNTPRSDEELSAFFRDHYADALPLMPGLVRDFRANPTGSLVTVRCWPWMHRGNVVLLGDAAHAIVPFFGQGMNAAFEDCRELAEWLRGSANLEQALDGFQHARKPNADAIAEMALANFVEMRDKVADPAFRYRKRVEQALHSAFPGRVSPQYNLVSFSTVPYVEALRKGRELDAVLDRVVARVPLADDTPSWRERVRAAGAEALGGSMSGVERPIIDITPRVTERLAVWPGDTAFSRQVLMDLTKGDSVTLSTIRSTVHLGAHADGPNHYGADAPGIGERPLHMYVGECVVVHADVGRGCRVGVRHIEGGLGRITAPRVLIRTNTFPDPERWNEDFAALDPDLVEALWAVGVHTIGIDTPSVDLFSSKDLPAHKKFLRRDMAILEGLVLAGVSQGRYELIALPLSLPGVDASPVRAVLRPM